MASVAQQQASPKHNSNGSSTSEGTSATSTTSPAAGRPPAAAAAKSPLTSMVSRDTGPGLVPAAPECSYTPCFCEENVWKLCEHINNSDEGALARTFVAFVSNKKQVVPLWRQKAGKGDEKLVIWDYHAVLLHRQAADNRCLVFDLDSDLPFPTYFHKYVTETFRTDAILNAEYHRFFRVLPAALYLQRFASDRRHMKSRQEGGQEWLKQPPSHPPIRTADCEHNLEQFVSMEEEDDGGFGEVISLKDFVQRFFKT